MLLFNSTGIQKLIWNVMVSYQSFSHLRQEFDISTVIAAPVPSYYYCNKLFSLHY